MAVYYVLHLNLFLLYKRYHISDIRHLVLNYSTDVVCSSGGRSKEPAWKIHVRHILSVRRDVFPLTTEKDGKRRGRYHALDELQYANRQALQATKTQLNVGGLVAADSSMSGHGLQPATRRQKRRSHAADVDATIRPPPYTHVS